MPDTTMQIYPPPTTPSLIQPPARCPIQDEQAALEALCFLSAAALPAKGAHHHVNDNEDDHDMPLRRRSSSPRAARQRQPARKKREADEAGLDDLLDEHEAQLWQAQQRQRRQTQEGGEGGPAAAQLLKQLSRRGFSGHDEGLAGTSGQQHEGGSPTGIRKRPRNSRKSSSGAAWHDARQQEQQQQQQQGRGRQLINGAYASAMETDVVREAIATKSKPLNGITQHQNGRRMASPQDDKQQQQQQLPDGLAGPVRPHAHNLPNGVEAATAAPAAIAAAAAAAAHLHGRNGSLPTALSGALPPEFDAWLAAQAGLWPTAKQNPSQSFGSGGPATAAATAFGAQQQQQQQAVPLPGTAHAPGAAPSDFTAAIPTKMAPPDGVVTSPTAPSPSDVPGDGLDQHVRFRPPCPGSSCHVYIANFIAACEQRKRVAAQAARGDVPATLPFLIPGMHDRSHSLHSGAAAALLPFTGHLPAALQRPGMPPGLAGRSSGLLPHGMPPLTLPQALSGFGGPAALQLPMSLMPPAVVGGMNGGAGGGVAASAAAAAAAAAAGLLPLGLGSSHQVAAAAAAAAAAAPFLLGGASNPAAAAALAQGLGLHGGAGLGPLGNFPQLPGLNPEGFPQLPFSFPPSSAPLPLPLAAAMSRAFGGQLGPQALNPNDALLGALRSELGQLPGRDMPEVVGQLEFLAARGLGPQQFGPGAADIIAKAMAGAAAAGGGPPPALASLPPGVPPELAAAFLAARGGMRPPLQGGLPIGSSGMGGNGPLPAALLEAGIQQGVPADMLQRLWQMSSMGAGGGLNAPAGPAAAAAALGNGAGAGGLANGVSGTGSPRVDGSTGPAAAAAAAAGKSAGEEPSAAPRANSSEGGAAGSPRIGKAPEGSKSTGLAGSGAAAAHNGSGAAIRSGSGNQLGSPRAPARQHVDALRQEVSRCVDVAADAASCRQKALFVRGCWGSGLPRAVRSATLLHLLLLASGNRCMRY